MSEPVRKPASYQDVLDAPEHVVAEVIDGELHLSPRPGPRHSRASTLIGIDIGPVVYRRGKGGGWHIHDEPELHLDPDIVVPDIAGWRIERMPRLPKQAFFTLPPDWVCEVLFPGTARRDRSSKARIYARHRVQFLWMVDPRVQTLEVYQLAGEFWQQLAVHGGDDRVRVPPFEELELDLGGWWEETDEMESDE